MKRSWASEHYLCVSDEGGLVRDLVLFLTLDTTRKDSTNGKRSVLGRKIMSSGAQLKRFTRQDELLAPFLLLLIGKLTGWTEPTSIGGDPVYLTGEQTASLAAEGISLLAPFLSEETSQRVTSAIAAAFDGTAGGPPTGGGAHGPGRVERIARLPQGSREQMLLNIGKLGWPTVFHSGGGEGPGCCVGTQHGLVCVRVRA
jgi:hypothetical protein